MPRKRSKLIFKSRHGIDGVGFIAHRLAQKKFFENILQEPRKVTLGRSLPRQWEKVCYVGRNTKGRSNPDYLPEPGFRAGDVVTIISAIFYPGIGTMYSFLEGARGNYLLRQDQINEMYTPKEIVNE